MNKKTELRYFNIGKCYGGNQRWMMDPWMHLGGCAALTACDIMIYLALRRDRPWLWPYPVDQLTRRQYVKFAMSVKPYLQPRETGIKDIQTYMDGVRMYFEDVDENGIAVSGTEGSADFELAADIVTSSLDGGMPVAYLMLKHQDREFEFFEWHWFPVIGYEQRKDGIYIKAATYGKEHWLPFERLWDTGCDEKGGLVTYSIKR